MGTAMDGDEDVHWSRQRNNGIGDNTVYEDSIAAASTHDVAVLKSTQTINNRR